MEKNFGRLSIFDLTPFPCTYVHVSWSVVYFDELNHMKVSNIETETVMGQMYGHGSQTIGIRAIPI